MVVYARGHLPRRWKRLTYTEWCSRILATWIGSSAALASELPTTSVPEGFYDQSKW